MQINTIHKLQYTLDTSVKILKFFWRHLLTLIVIGMMFNTVHISTANWKNILITLVITAFIDRVKAKIRFTGSNYNPGQDQMFESSKWSRPAQIGSAWDPYTPGSSEYYIRQDRYC